MVIFPHNTISLMVNVKALVFKPSLKKSPKSLGSIKIPVLTQKDNFQASAERGTYRICSFNLLPRPHSQLCKYSGDNALKWVGECESLSCLCN